MNDPQRPSEDEDKTVEQPAVGGESPKKPAEPETPAAAPAGPPPGWVPAPQAPPAKGGFRRFAGHRATQLVAVGVLGFLLGGGVIGTAVGLASRDGDRPGFSREHHGSAGPGGHRDFRGGHGDRDWRDESHGR
ncbi:hypothetical protein [Amycolatopsis regifaucium]|uniref:Uncharacterized protein n=1 Tax=Amycolatopsis regifaucium TaxID=546365 RepID=A0A154MAN7_9PSEU|nr:hypothetical protein [Amycolatopsis regifaucium]KZB81671.1 hypothetical protein AVL48_06685 [Amycolatopsis regifaucium]OKA06264.1 hypothetical protein ATP06_0224335 [Amycolatopsis regifaucium]SFG67309.1 hypothetical protein SAMN04489731_101102 [Amycolatopsis regifaucium]